MTLTNLVLNDLPFRRFLLTTCLTTPGQKVIPGWMWI